MGRERNCYERTSHSLESPGSGPPPGRKPGGPAGGETETAAEDLQTLAAPPPLTRRPVRRAKPAIRAVAGWEVVLTGQTGTFSRSENRLMTGDELYGIGSVSKIYTTVAVMQLAEDGKVSLDAR